MGLSFELFSDEPEEMKEFQNYINIHRKINSNPSPDEMNILEGLLSFYRRFDELISINLQEGNDWIFIDFYNETH